MQSQFHGFHQKSKQETHMQTTHIFLRPQTRYLQFITKRMKLDKLRVSTRLGLLASGRQSLAITRRQSKDLKTSCRSFIIFTWQKYCLYPCRS